MVKYIIKRVLLGILTLFVLIAITFAMTKVMPGSPLQSKNISGELYSSVQYPECIEKDGSNLWIRQTAGRTVHYIL